MNGYVFRIRKMVDGKISDKFCPIYIDEKNLESLKEEKTLLFSIEKLEEVLKLEK